MVLHVDATQPPESVLRHIVAEMAGAGLLQGREYTEVRTVGVCVRVCVCVCVY